MTTEQLAYIAALIDGEGSLECQKQKQAGAKNPQYRTRLSFTMVTEEPLLTLSHWLDINPPRKYPASDLWRSPFYRMHIPKTATLTLLQNCMPYIILKKRQAEILLEMEVIRQKYSPAKRHVGHAKFQPMPQEAIALFEEKYVEFRSLKLNKRPLKNRPIGGDDKWAR